MPNITTYLTDTEYQTIKESAKELDVSVSQYIRNLIQKQKYNQLEQDVKFIRGGLENHWKTKFPEHYQAASLASLPPAHP